MSGRIIVSVAVVIDLNADTTPRRLKNASQSKQEAARLEVENAEDDLVQKTEVAITLMKTVLENVSAPSSTLSSSLSYPISLLFPFSIYHEA